MNRPSYCYGATKRPSYYYDNSEEALCFICKGCPKETGWLDDPIIETPWCALQIVEDEECLDDDGACLHKQMIAKAEYRKYLRRMNGDWS